MAQFYCTSTLHVNVQLQCSNSNSTAHVPVNVLPHVHVLQGVVFVRLDGIERVFLCLNTGSTQDIRWITIADERIETSMVSLAHVPNVIHTTRCLQVSKSPLSPL